MTETQIQAKISNILKDDGWLILRLALVRPNGMPDLLALKNSKAVFIEVKRPNKKARKLQLYRHKQLRDKGFDVYVMSDPETAKSVLVN